jgi:propionate CoA-transferase
VARHTGSLLAVCGARNSSSNSSSGIASRGGKRIRLPSGRYYTLPGTGGESDGEDIHPHQGSPLNGLKQNLPSHLTYNIPERLRQKVISSTDAVSLVRDGDTICASGFVCQGVPEAVLKALGERYEATGSPNNLTLFFGGGPGDWETRGLNHLAKTKEGKPPMLRRTIGSHYGQVPMVAELALTEQVEAWTLPLGSVSRMIRAQSTHSPGHITDVGIGTYVDPDISGGAANEAAKKSTLHEKLISRIQIEGQDQLMYKSLPINVAIVRGTTADTQGNITAEEESLFCDQKIIAAAARNSGGVVIAQVKRLAANGSLNPKDIVVPGPLVDCVVVVDNPNEHSTLHPMSFEENHNPALTGEIKSPSDELPKMALDIRKLIARRAAFLLRPNTIVNLGIGLPEGVANIAAEEGMLDYVTLSTEPGVFGGLPASGKSFGPSYNASALMEMNQMFDFYDGGGLDRCFLGAAEISKSGDVNVSRMSKDRLTGPGGFIDISQSTNNICFMTPFTTKGLKLSIPGDGSLEIEKEGKVKKFVDTVFEKTFSGDEAVRRGQKVFYVTERAVFRRTAKSDFLELIEIAPGIDLQKDILDHMDFEPAISGDLKLMDERIFTDERMNMRSELFGSLMERFRYHEKDHTMFLELFGITINSEDDIDWMVDGLIGVLDPLVKEKGKIGMIVDLDGFDIRKGLESKYVEAIREKVQKPYYRNVKRFASSAFRRAELGKQMSVGEWDPAELYDEFDVNHDGTISLDEIREGMKNMFQLKLTSAELAMFRSEGEDLPENCICSNKRDFERGLKEVLKNTE